MSLYLKLATKFPSSSLHGIAKNHERSTKSLNLKMTMAMSTSASVQMPSLVGPAAKLLLFHYNIEANFIKNHSGPKKNLLKSDILHHIKNAKLTPNNLNMIGSKIGNETTKTIKQQKYMDIPLTNMRQTIAKRLSQSKNSIPHAYISTSISSNKIQQLRVKYSKKYNLKLSINDFIIKACAQNLRNFPQLNVQWKNERVHQIPTVDVSIAVATPYGLITPILFGADEMSVDQISRKLRDLAGRAREGKLRPEEFQGGTFTISNLGMFRSVSNFTAIINPPQAAILAVGTLMDAFNPDLRNPGLFYATLSYNARAIEDTNALKFMQNLQFSLTEPSGLLVGMETSMGVEDEEDQWNLAEIDMKNTDFSIADSDAKNIAKFLL